MLTLNLRLAKRKDMALFVANSTNTRIVRKEDVTSAEIVEKVDGFYVMVRVAASRVGDIVWEVEANLTDAQSKAATLLTALES